MTQHIDPCDTARNNFLAAGLALQHCTKTASSITQIPGRDQIIAIGTKADVARLLELGSVAATTQASTAQAERSDDAAEGLELLDSLISNIEAEGNYSSEATLTFLGQIRQCFAATSSTDAQAAPTDLSKRLRAAATAEVSYADARLLIGAAEEIERYYGGMMAWKRTAEAKDADAQAAAEVREAWISVGERLPEVGELVLVYSPPTKYDHPGEVNIGFDCIDPNDDDHASWLSHNEHYEHFCCVAKPEGSTGPSADAPYTHWMPLPAAPELRSAGDTGGAR